MGVFNRKTFKERVEVVRDPAYSWGINLGCGTELGLFCRDELPVLVDFVKRNPEFHIITTDHMVTFNKMIPEGRLFMLAVGDKDPRLGYTDALTPEERFELGIERDYSSWNSGRTKVFP